MPGVDDTWQCVDSVTGVSVEWVEGRFDGTQLACWPDSLVGVIEDPASLATAMRELPDWLLSNYGELL